MSLQLTHLPLQTNLLRKTSERKYASCLRMHMAGFKLSVSILSWLVSYASTLNTSKRACILSSLSSNTAGPLKFNEATVPPSHGQSLACVHCLPIEQELSFAFIHAVLTIKSNDAWVCIPHNVVQLISNQCRPVLSQFLCAPKPHQPTLDTSTCRRSCCICQTT